MDKISNLSIEERSVEIASGHINLEGNLKLPEAARGLVLFAHGSGSSRHSPRNRYVADVLNQGRFATLLLDLLTPEEEREDSQTGHLRFNITFLAERLITATEWLAQNRDLADLNVGYFGASTGAAAALVAAARRPQAVKAIVSRGGRPDLAKEALAEVRSPTLLIVGGNDTPVIEMNRSAIAQLQIETQLEIIPRATHLFPEPGALEEVARLAREWFERYLTRSF
ncbi:dienelactone hydrolase family protein [Myxosarcina sp. GI1(2024)]